MCHVLTLHKGAKKGYFMCDFKTQEEVWAYRA